MKSKLISYLAGVVTAITILSLPISALASDGSLTMAVTPVRVQVNGEVFQPSEGFTFTSDGTTYAPVRALAEACGLEARYDAAQNLVTVNTPAAGKNAAPLDDFAAQWTVRSKPVTGYGDEKIFTATYSGSLSMEDFKAWWKALGNEAIKAGAEQLAAEAQDVVGGKVTMYFDYHGYALGTAYDRGSFTSSDFAAAGIWIK